VGLFTIIADRFDGAAFHGFLAEGFLFRSLRLLEDDAMATIILALKIGGSGLATQVAVDALIVNVVLSGDVL
jgi:hypothetical protein